MCPTLISASAILPKKNPHPHNEPAAVHAANPNTFLFPGFRITSATILPLSHTREWKKVAEVTTASGSQLPDAAAVHRHHRRSLLTSERRRKPRLVHNRAVRAEVIRRVRIGQHLV